MELDNIYERACSLGLQLPRGMSVKKKNTKKTQQTKKTQNNNKKNQTFELMVPLSMCFNLRSYVSYSQKYTEEIYEENECSYSSWQSSRDSCV